MLHACSLGGCFENAIIIGRVRLKVTPIIAKVCCRITEYVYKEQGWAWIMVILEENIIYLQYGS